MLLFVGKWCLFILDFFVHSCVVSVLSQSVEKIPSKEGGGGGGVGKVQQEMRGVHLSTA